MSGTQRLDWVSRPAKALHGDVVVPGDKSVSHRSMMLSAIAEGTSHIRGFLEGEDTRATAAVLAQLGVRVEAPSAGERIVHGVGLHGLRASSKPLDCGNAGTGMRLLAGLLATQTAELSEALVKLESMKGLNEHLDRIHELEHQADGISRAAIGRLFRENHDPLEVIKWREIYLEMENAIDAAEDAAEVIERMVHKRV